MSEPGSPFIDENEPPPNEPGTAPAAGMDRQRKQMIIGASVAGVALLAGGFLLVRPHLAGDGADTGSTQAASAPAAPAIPTIAPTDSPSPGASNVPVSARDPFKPIVSPSASPAGSGAAGATSTGAPGAGALGAPSGVTVSPVLPPTMRPTTDFFGVPGLAPSGGGSSTGSSSSGGGSSSFGSGSAGGGVTETKHAAKPTPKPAAKPKPKPAAKPKPKPAAKPKPTVKPKPAPAPKPAPKPTPTPTPAPKPTASPSPSGSQTPAAITFYVGDDAFTAEDGSVRVPVYLNGNRIGAPAVGDQFGKGRFTCTAVDLTYHKASFTDSTTNSSFTVNFDAATTR